MRVYSTYFDNITMTAVQDVFYIKAGAANPLELHLIELTSGTLINATVRLRLKRMPATVTVGSVGTAPTIGFVDSGDTKAATAVVRANDTTQSTSSGTVVYLNAWHWQILNPWIYEPEVRETIQAAEALVLDIPAAPASMVVSGRIRWREF